MANHRYNCYAHTHGKSPDEMVAYDKQRFPGGCMTEYLIWNSQRIEEWKTITGYKTHYLTPEAHINYDIWLGEKVGLSIVNELRTSLKELVESLEQKLFEAATDAGLEQHEYSPKIWGQLVKAKQVIAKAKPTPLNR